MNKVLSVLTGNTVGDPSSVIIQGWVGSNMYNTGCLIKAKHVYSICSGVVISRELDPQNDTWSITVEVNSQCWVRYCMLSSYNVSAGAAVKSGDSIGASRRGSMRLEYCNAEPSLFPVRVPSRQLYKHDPAPIIFGSRDITGVA